MILKDLYSCNCLNGIKLLTDTPNLNLEINSINIVEATDIENWGKKGMLLLSSYFAFKDLSKNDLDKFIYTVKNLECSAILLKVNRLVEKIPNDIIDICNKYNVALFKIGASSKYHEIIKEVLSKILQNKENELSLYYKVNKLSTQMFVAMYSLQEILDKFKDLLSMNLALEDKTNHKFTSTNINFNEITILEKTALLKNEYMTYNYERYNYINDKNKGIKNLLQIDISCTDNKKHYLYILENSLNLTTDDIVIIENLIMSLQMYILREYMSNQKSILNQTKVLSELISENYTTEQEIKEALTTLGLNLDYKCNILTLKFNSDDNNFLSIRNELQKLLHQEFNNIKFYGYGRYISILFYWNNKEENSIDIKNIHKLLLYIREKKLPNLNLFSYFGGLSDDFDILNINEAINQSKMIANFLLENNKNNSIENFSSLGIFKIFLLNPTGKLKEFIPPSILDLYENNNDLYITLKQYVRNNCNFTTTSSDLYIHPKTVKYRIEKIIELTSMDLTNSMNLATLEISFNIIDYLFEKK